MSGTAWPPPATDARPWHERELRVRGAEFGSPAPLVTVTVRQVRLWGKDVFLNEAEDAVWCPHCRRFMPVADPAALQAHIAPSSAIQRFESAPARPRGVADAQW